MAIGRADVVGRDMQTENDRIVALEHGVVRDLGAPAAALSGSSPYATEIGALYPGGPVTLEGMPRCA